MNSTYNTKIFMDAIMETLSKKQPILAEKLEPHEQDEVESTWDLDRPKHIDNAIHNVFQGKNRIEIPFHVGSVEPHPEVEEHLTQHGYKITDYLGGKAKDKYNRETNIGKALGKTNAPEHIKALYDNDPERQQKASKMKIVISHKPSDVAGMTSCGHSWEDESCMNFHSGKQRDYLKHDVRQGTHVAYLTSEDDNDLNHPVGRIAVKPFHEYDSGEEHTIFRPEGKAYGAAPQGFSKQVFDWFSKHYPARKDTVYIKNDHVYDDDNQDRYREYSPEMLDKKVAASFKGEHSFTGGMPEENVNYVVNRLKTASKEDMDKFSSMHNSGIERGMARHQVNDLYDAANKVGSNFMMDYLREKRGGDLSLKNIKHTIASGKKPTEEMVAHRYFPKEEIPNLSNNLLYAIHPKNMTSDVLEHITNRYANGENAMFGHLNHYKDNLKKEQLKSAISTSIRKNKIPNMSAFLTAKNADESVFDHAEEEIKGTDGLTGGHEQYLNALAVRHPNPQAKHVAMATNQQTLNGIMTNAKDKFIHNLALHKSIGGGDDSVMDIKLKNPKANEYIGDNEIAALNKHQQLLDYRPHVMPHGVFSRMLDSDENKVRTLTDRIDSGDESAKSEFHRAMMNHAKKLYYRMSEQLREAKTGGKIYKEEHFDNLNRMEHMMKHKYYGDHHAATEDRASELNREILERGQ